MNEKKNIQQAIEKNLEKGGWGIIATATKSGAKRINNKEHKPFFDELEEIGKYDILDISKLAADIAILAKHKKSGNDCLIFCDVIKEGATGPVDIIKDISYSRESAELIGAEKNVVVHVGKLPQEVKQAYSERLLKPILTYNRKGDTTIVLRYDKDVKELKESFDKPTRITD
ncbi:hypothetical protein N8809_02600 [Euryarchaeota archaeon]|nr:hypothetical protein [Euryarchaeota archaeon]